MKINISERARKYGYIYWSKDEEGKIEQLFKGLGSVEVWFNGSRLGKKNIDRQYRRISVGWKQTRQLPASVIAFNLKVTSQKTLRIEVE